MQNQPLVSVIIPTYKREVFFVSRAVNSVLLQTYPHLQLIVIDDSPSDFEHRGAVAEFMRSLNDNRVIFLQNEKNMGGSLARNRGIDIAEGEYITFLDDDDEYLPSKIENQIRFMRESDCDLSFSDMRMYNNSGSIVDCRTYADIPSFDNGTLLRYHLMKHMTGTPTFMYKTDMLREIGGFEDAKMGQEFYLMLKSIERGLKIAYLPQCDVKIYKHAAGGITQGKNKINGENRLYEFKKKYFPCLSSKEIRFINFRHWAVMVVAYKRNKQIYLMPYAGIRAFFSSPKDFFSEIIRFLKKINNAKNGR